jgi:hemerythrin-like metal-binding protein
MPLLSWKPEYSVNEVVLDCHHQKLFDLLNTVYDNVMNSLEVDYVLPVIDDLLKYTRLHFLAEEQYMRENAFHDIDAHISKHRGFTYTIERMKTHYHGNKLEVAQELIIVLGEWLLHHVIKDDMKYADLSSGFEVRDNFPFQPSGGRDCISKDQT